MVQQISRRIIAALRNRQFFSLNEVNNAVHEELIKLINRPFKNLEGNRRIAFEKIDKQYLQPLPANKYEYAEWKEAKVAFNYHVEYDGFYYSVSYTLINSPCSIRATINTIEIFVDHERVAVHPRNYDIFKQYHTLPEHMPDNHKAVYCWNSDRFLSWAERIGPKTKELIRNVLESREYPVQTYRACMGIMRLAEQYGSLIMESASEEALEKQTYTYKYVNIIIKQLILKRSDKNNKVTADPSKSETLNLEDKIIQHENVRGKDAFRGGLGNA